MTWCPWRLLTIQSILVDRPRVTVCTEPLVPGEGGTGGPGHSLLLPGERKSGRGGGGGVGEGGAGEVGEGEENSSQKFLLNPG